MYRFKSVNGDRRGDFRVKQRLLLRGGQRLGLLPCFVPKRPGRRQSMDGLRCFLEFVLAISIARRRIVLALQVLIEGIVGVAIPRGEIFETCPGIGRLEGTHIAR